MIKAVGRLGHALKDFFEPLPITHFLAPPSNHGVK